MPPEEPHAHLRVEPHRALVSRGPASWFGLVAGGDLAPVVSSRDAQGRTYDTRAYGFTVGARMRVSFWRAEAGLTVAYTHQAYTIDRGAVSAAPPEGIPSVTYQSVRAAVSGRVQVIPRLAVTVRGGYLFVVDAGELGSAAFFPRNRTGGVEAGVGVAVPLVAGLEARLDVDWRRYFSSMRPEVGDRLIAGGAADDFYGATLGVAWRR